MTQDTLNSLPTEILLLIFAFLPAKQLMKCRQVCLRWKDAIAFLSQSESLWQKNVIDEYADVYKTVRKNRPGLSWYHMYRSLSLWPQLNHAEVVIDEFASNKSTCEEIVTFEVLQNGIMGVHTRNAIVFFDTGTFERSRRSSLRGDYCGYAENDDVVMLHDCNYHLYIIRKVSHLSDPVKHAAFNYVKKFILLDSKMYYITLKDEIYLCNIHEDDFNAEYLATCPDKVLSLGYKNNMLIILTIQKNIYVLNGHNLTCECTLVSNSNLFQIFQKYELLDHLPWRMYFNWMFLFRQEPLDLHTQEIITVKAYGHVYFVGCKWGTLRIYYAPHFKGEYNLFTAEPIKKFNFMKCDESPNLTMCSIMAIDVLEDINGHTVLVAMPRKIAVLKFQHDLMRMELNALVPFNTMQEIERLKIDECISLET